MDKKARTAYAFSIIAAVLFLLATIFSIINIVELANTIEYYDDKADYCSEDYFYEHADLQKRYYYSSYYSYYDYYDYYDYDYYFEDSYYGSYDAYRDMAELFEDYRDESEQAMPFYIIFTIAFAASAVGAFMSRKKSFPLPLLIAQAVSWIMSILFFMILMFNVYDEAFAIIFAAIYLVFGSAYMAYCLLISLDKIKGKSVLAKLFAIPMIFNAAAIVFVVVMLNVEFLHYFTPVFIIEAILLAHAFIFYYIGVSIRHNSYRKRQQPAQPIAVAQPVYVQQPVVQPVYAQQPVAQPVFVQQPVAQPVYVQQPVVQPVAQPVYTQQPAAQPVAQPVYTQQPAAQPVAQPVTESTENNTEANN